MDLEQRAILFYDADCGFCQKSVDWLKKRIDPTLFKSIPYQQPDIATSYPEIDLTRANHGVQILTSSRSVLKNEQAIAHCLLKTRSWKWAGHLIRFPILGLLAAFVYSIIAANRRVISKLIGANACRLPDPKT